MCKTIAIVGLLLLLLPIIYGCDKYTITIPPSASEPVVSGNSSKSGVDENSVTEYNPSEIINSVIGVNGVNADKENIIVSNFHSGARAEVGYCILNNTDNPINPEIFVNYDRNPDDYPKAIGYSKTPTEAKNWLHIPSIGSGVIQARESQYYLVVLEMPADAQLDIDKWAFCTGVAIGSSRYQLGTETWWLVDMR